MTVPSPTEGLCQQADDAVADLVGVSQEDLCHTSLHGSIVESLRQE
jgi:hypothetical protein